MECISESLCIEETPLPLKVARLYLVNDILQNCSAHIPNASFFRRGQVHVCSGGVCMGCVGVGWGCRCVGGVKGKEVLNRVP